MPILPQGSPRAAVLVALCEFDNEDHVLLTQRAKHLSIHSGEVAFPGGKWEMGDLTLRDTALRESFEEVGLEPDLVSVLGELPSGYTRGKIAVKPYVGRISNDVSLIVNRDELDSLFWAPIRFFCEDQRLRTDIFTFHNKEFWSPAYEYMGYTIWGITARILVDLLDHYYGVTLLR